jgi:glycosyltransferase involved in cell wall biosynthesis
MQTPIVGSVLIVLHRVGPYHHARFQAAAAALQCPLLVLQTRPHSQEYPWSFVVEGAAYTLQSLEGCQSPEQDPPRSVLRHQLEELLERYQPSVIVSVGWADRAYLQLMRLAQQRSVPLVVVSDSRRQDSARSPWKEWLKRQLIRGYSAGIVAGTQSRAYIRQLGMKAEAIQQPWDVVNNQLFAQLAAEATTETRFNLEAPFLCVGRFIPEKNHALLLEAFSNYQSNGGIRSLLLVGHGPLEHQIRHACQQLPRPHAVKMAPFVELEKLAIHYGRSHALVLASRKDTWALVVNEAMAAGLPVIVSRACGCVDDLVEDGVNGWSFACDDVQGLVECLEQSDRQLAEERKTMTSLAKLRLKDFAPESFALGLKKACEHAVLNKQNSWRSRTVSRFLDIAA